MGRWWFLLQSGGYLVPQRQLHTQSKLVARFNQIERI